MQVPSEVTDVSRRHAEVSPLRDNAYELLDLDSSNGTFVNGVRVTRHVLHPGDVITLGSATKLTFGVPARKPKPTFTLGMVLAGVGIVGAFLLAIIGVLGTLQRAQSPAEWIALIASSVFLNPIVWIFVAVFCAGAFIARKGPYGTD